MNQWEAVNQWSLTPLIILFIYILFQTPFVLASEFDCDHSPLTDIEKTICSDKALYYFDRLLNVAYQRALQTAKNASIVKQKQRKWLISRDSCKDAACMKELYSSQLEWISEQPRRPVYYKQIMSKNNKVCDLALKYFNQDIDKEYPQPSSDVISSTTTLPRNHVPYSISPHWIKSSLGWTANVDLDWDGIADSITKAWGPLGFTYSGERMIGWLDVVNGYNPEFKQAEYSFTQELYTLKNHSVYKPRKSNKSLYDQSYIDEDNSEFIQADHFDVAIIDGKAYVTFVSYDLPDGLFEDWKYRKWRVINRYTGSLENENDICHFLLIRN